MHELLKYFHSVCGHKSIQFKRVTHSKLIVWVHRSFPHRPGIVKTLHVVGLVEATLCNRREAEVQVKLRK